MEFVSSNETIVYLLAGSLGFLLVHLVAGLVSAPLILAAYFAARWLR